MKKILFSAAFALTVSNAHAAFVDFENALSPTEDVIGFSPNSAYREGPITFTSSEEFQLVRTGKPQDAFVPNDTLGGGDEGLLGDVFITGDFNDNTDMALDFDTDLTSISFIIADIDGSGRDQEQFTLQYFLDGNLVDTQSFNSGDGDTGDAVATDVFFSGVFDRLEIAGVTPNGTRNIGWALDNIEVTPVPVPAGFALFLTGLAGAGAIRRRFGAKNA